MRFLADAGISPLSVELLIQFGHEAVHVLAERSSDLESGTLILVEDARYRVRKLPIRRAPSTLKDS